MEKFTIGDRFIAKKARHSIIQESQIIITESNDNYILVSIDTNFGDEAMWSPNTFKKLIDNGTFVRKT